MNATNKENKMKFFINEKQNVNSYREPKECRAKTLNGAKRSAVRSRCFLGTVITVEDNDGNTLAYKEYGERWVDVE
jgi:hypothetical protein